MFENIRLSFQGIFGHKLRSFLTMLGIIIGIAAIIAIVSTIKGTNDQIKENLVGSGSNIVQVNLSQGGMEITPSDGYNLTHVPIVDDAIIEKILDIESVIDVAKYHKASTWQGVNHGEVIGYTGHTGSATGSELHIECEYQGESYNPLFYFENGEGSLYPTNADTGEYIPVEATGDAAALIHEAMNYLDYPYVWGGSTPETSFDCSGFVSWCLNNSGYADVGRQTAQGLCNKSHRISADNSQPGDLIFFEKTYDTVGASHVGIYVGNGMMLHCGDPIQYTSIETNYWQQHFLQFGRLPRP